MYPRKRLLALAIRRQHRFRAHRKESRCGPCRGHSPGIHGADGAPAKKEALSGDLCPSKVVGNARSAWDRAGRPNQHQKAYDENKTR